MKALVVGAGQMGRAAGYELHCRGVDVVFADIKTDITLPGWYNHLVYDANNLDELIQNEKSSEPFNVILGCTTYTANLELTKLAIENGIHYCDLGGNNSIVKEQLSLTKKAEAAGCFVIPDCGLAPGLAPMIAAYGIEEVGGRADQVSIYVGGLPILPQEPFNYATSWSVSGLINEYKEKCVSIVNGTIIEENALDRIVDFDFAAAGSVDYEFCGWGGENHKMEAFNTSGGLSTLCDTYLGKVNELFYKTIRYAGHANIFKSFAELGFFEGPMREQLEKQLNNVLPKIDQDNNDMVLVRVRVLDKDDKMSVTYRMVTCGGFIDNEYFSAMAKTTGFSIAAIAYMLGTGEITKYNRGRYSGGVLPGEIVLPLHNYLYEFQNSAAIKKSLTTVNDLLIERETWHSKIG